MNEIKHRMAMLLIFQIFMSSVCFGQSRQYAKDRLGECPVQFPEHLKQMWNVLESVDSLRDWPKTEPSLTKVMRCAEPESIERAGVLGIVIQHAKFSASSKRLELVEWLTENLLLISKRAEGDIYELLVFSPDDFSKTARRNLHNHCHYLRYPSGCLFMLMALLNEHGRYMEQIRKYAESVKDPDDVSEEEKFYTSSYKPFYLPAGGGWDCLRILARDGDKDAINKIVKIFNHAEPDAEHHIHQFAEDLWMVHQPEILNLLESLLNSDKEFEIGLAGAAEHRLVAHQTLRKMLRGYPASLTEARKWMKEQTEWEFLGYWERPEK